MYQLRGLIKTEQDRQSLAVVILIGKNGFCVLLAGRQWVNSHYQYVFSFYL